MLNKNSFTLFHSRESNYHTYKLTDKNYLSNRAGIHDPGFKACNNNIRQQSSK